MISTSSPAPFEDLLENRIKLSKYQYWLLFFLCLVDLNDGVELITMSLVIPILKREWTISPFWIEVLTSIFYFGMFFGAFLTGKIADRYGRRPTILYASIFQFLVGFCFAFVNDLFTLIFMRFLYGFCYGFSLPLTISMISEIFPLRVRGKAIIFTNFCVSIGKVYGILLAFITLDDYQTGNWRALMIVSSLTCLIVILGVGFYVKESPRFLLASKYFPKAFEVIDHIGKVNNPDFEPLSFEEKQKLTEYHTFHHSPEEQANPKMIFSKRFMPVTIRLWILWFVLIYFEFGLLVILPFLFLNQKAGFSSLLITIGGELPSLIVSMICIDLKSAGRKKTLTISIAILSFLNFSAFFSAETGFLPEILSAERFFMKNCFSMLVPLTSELYPTHFRTVGYGLATAMGRIAATLSPYILLPLFEWHNYASFILFGIMCFVGMLASQTIPFDTTNAFLDVWLVKEEKVNFSGP